MSKTLGDSIGLLTLCVGISVVIGGAGGAVVQSWALSEVWEQVAQERDRAIAELEQEKERLLKEVENAQRHLVAESITVGTAESGQGERIEITSNRLRRYSKGKADPVVEITIDPQGGAVRVAALNSKGRAWVAMSGELDGNVTTWDRDGNPKGHLHQHQ